MTEKKKIKIPFSTRGDTTVTKKLRLLRVLELVKENEPIRKDEMISKIELEEGLSEKLADNYLKILFDNKRIEVTRDSDMVITIRRSDNDSKESN